MGGTPQNPTGFDSNMVFFGWFGGTPILGKLHAVFWWLERSGKLAPFAGTSKHIWGVPARHGASPSWMVSNGKTQSKMDDLGVPLFHETPVAGWQQGWRLQSCRHQGAWDFASDWVVQAPLITNVSGFDVGLQPHAWYMTWEPCLRVQETKTPEKCSTFFCDTAPLSCV